MLLATILAATLEATITGAKKPIDVILLRRDESERWQLVAQRRQAQRHVRFDRLSAGAYAMLLRGEGPGEQLAAQARLGDAGTRRIDLAIRPIRLTGRVTLADLPLVGGSIELSERESPWRVRIPIGADGSYDAVLWQSGNFDAAVRSPALATPWIDTIAVRAAPAIHRDFRLPNRRVIGHFADAATGAPIAGATVWLAQAVGDGHRNFRTTTDAEGRFDLAAVAAGSYTVEASASRYLDGQPLPFTLAEEDRLREIDVRLQAGVATPVVVVGSDGAAVPGAEVIAVTEGARRSSSVTDAEGSAVVALPAGEASTIYAFPREGSFAVAHVGAADAGARRRMIVPQGASSLRIVAQTTEGLPLADVAMLVRFDGTLIPPAVGRALQVRTGPDGEAMLRRIPPGSYELWPYQTAEEAEAVVASGGLFAAPIQVNVHVGENAVGVKFRAR